MSKKIRKMFKLVTVFVLLVCLVMSSIPITFAKEENSGIKSVEIYDVDCIQYTNGYWDYDYNEETDDFDLRYYLYLIEPDFNITFNDGTVLESENGHVEYNGEVYYVEYYLYQDFENQLSVGTYTVNASVKDYETSFNINILDTPVESVEINDLKYFQYTNGEWLSDSWNEKYYCYWFSPDFTVMLKDGTILESTDGVVEYNGEVYSVDYDFDQSYEHRLGLGDYTIEATVMGFTSSFNVTIVENPVQSVKVKDMKFFQYTNGEWLYDYNEETGDYDLKYFSYYIGPEFEVTFKDGSVQESQECQIEYNGEWYYLDYDITQDYYNQLDVGTHFISASLFDVATSFRISIIESPVQSVEIDDVKYYQYTNGYWDYDYNEETDDFDLSYFSYYIGPEFTVTLKDGTVLESEEGGIEYDGEYQYLEFDLSQGYDNELGVGTHTVAANLMGYDTSFNITIVDVPVQSVEINNVEYIQYTNGYWASAYNEETDDYDLPYFSYYIGSEFTVTLKDGTVLESEEGGIEYDGEYQYLEFDLPQGYDNELSVGTYTVAANLMGYETSFNVTILDTPVQSVEIEDLEYIQYTNGHWGYDYNEETDEFDLKYYHYFNNPEFTVTLKDGTVLKSEDGWIEYNGEFYTLDCVLYQDYNHQLGLGTHTIDATVLGYKTDFNVTILDTPVQSVEIEDLEYIQYTNGYWAYYYNEEYYIYYFNNPEFTVTLKDGTVLKSEDGQVEYNGNIYYVNYTVYQGYGHQLYLGEHTIDASVMGYETSFNVNIIENTGAQLGDVNGDGDVTIDDVTSIQMYLSDIISLKDEQFEVADVNGDGDITVDDATIIQMYLAGIITSY